MKMHPVGTKGARVTVRRAESRRWGCSFKLFLAVLARLPSRAWKPLFRESWLPPPSPSTHSKKTKINKENIIKHSDKSIGILPKYLSINSLASELSILIENTAKAKSYGLRVNAGHGLTYQNVEPIAAIKGIEELNIGHTIISRALAVGLAQAVKEMKYLIINPRKDNCFL